VCNTHSNLCITFVIAANFDKIVTRSGLILFVLRTERNKQFVMRESTKKLKRESTIIHGRPHKFFQGGTSTFCSSFSNCWRSVFPLRQFYTERIFVLVSMIILGLSKWSFQWITNFVNYIFTILSKYEQNTHFIKIAPCFRWSFHCFGMLQVRENEISLRNSSGGPEYLLILEGTLLTMQCKWMFTKRFIFSAQQRRCSMLR